MTNITAATEHANVIHYDYIFAWDRNLNEGMISILDDVNTSSVRTSVKRPSTGNVMVICAIFLNRRTTTNTLSFAIAVSVTMASFHIYRFSFGVCSDMWPRILFKCFIYYLRTYLAELVFLVLHFSAFL